jgi:hypothetical protein
MNIINNVNFSSLNSKYNTIFTNCVIKKSDYMVSVICDDNNSNSVNTNYNNLFNQYLLDKIDLNSFFLETKRNIDNILSINGTIVQQINKLNTLIKKIEMYMSFFDNKKYNLDGIMISQTIYHYICKKLNDKIKNEYSNALCNIIFYNLEKHLEFFNVLGSFFKNRSVTFNYENTNMNNLLISFYDNLSNIINTKLQQQFELSNDIEYVFSKINDIDNYFKLNFIDDRENNILKFCYPIWGNKLIESINFINAPIIIGHLQNIEPYIGTDVIADKIATNLISVLNSTVKKYQPFENHFNNIELYNILVDVTLMCEIILTGWKKYDCLHKKIIEFIDNLFESDIIAYYHIGFKKFIEEYCLNKMFEMGEATDKFPKKNIMSLISTFRSKNIDKSLNYYLSSLQSRHLNVLNDGKINEFKQMIILDKILFDYITNFIDADKLLKTFVQPTINKINSIISDLETTIKANIELNNVKINFVDSNNNSVEKPSYYNNKDKIHYLLTSNNGWTDWSKNISNNFDIKFTGELKHIVGTFSEFYKQKCPHRNLTIFNDLSTLIINYKLNENNYKLKVTLFQANVLMLFVNGTYKLSLEDIKSKIMENITVTELKNFHIKQVCDSLVNSKLLVNGDDKTYMVNYDLKLPSKYCVEPANVAKYFTKIVEPEQSTKTKVTETIEYDRINTLKCYTLKCFKSNKSNYYSVDEVFNMVLNTLKLFKISKEDVINTLNILEKTYYIDKKNDKYCFSDE